LQPEQPASVSRFFPCFQADDPADFAYIAKPSRAEKNAGCEEIAPVQQPHGMRTNACGRCGRLVLPSSTQIKCECGDLRETIQRPRGGNHHPTAKSVALMRWLLRLITEPGDIVLDPFGGSGTTGVAALAEGRRVIIIERDPAFAAICRARLSHAAPTAADLSARVAAPIAAPSPDFGPLFGPR
jgi:DNA modification methylase